MSPRTILTTVSKRLDIPYQVIKNSSALKEDADAVRIASVLIREHKLLSLKQTAKFFRVRNHSTIIRRVETHKDLMKTDKRYAAKFNKCIS